MNSTNFMKVRFQLVLSFFIIINVVSGQAVWMLNNVDPSLDNPTVYDFVHIFDQDGEIVNSFGGLHFGATIGSFKYIHVLKNGEEAWVSENASGKLSKFDMNGNSIVSLDIPPPPSTLSDHGSISSIDVLSNGELYVLNGPTIHGDSIYHLDAIGNYLNKSDLGGLDLVVDEKHGNIWTVGSNVKKLDLQLNHVFTKDPIGWTGVSIDHTSYGDIWFAERKLNESLGINRIYNISLTGELKDSVMLNYSPTCVRVNKKDNKVWVTTSDSLYQYNPSNKVLKGIGPGVVWPPIDRTLF